MNFVDYATDSTLLIKQDAKSWLVGLPDNCPKTIESVEKLLFQRDFICGDYPLLC